MFGSKLKTWMENHIGRPKRKAQQEKDKNAQSCIRGPMESSESLALSDTGISSGSQQVLSSSTTDNREGYCTTTMESERSGMSHCHTAVSLPSPESAYSTGYSTDGASPGGTGPPEYYINIRTGKHYFPSPAPTPTSPQPNTVFSPLAPFLESSLPSARTIFPPVTAVNSMSVGNNRKVNHFDIFSFSKSPVKKSSPKSQLSSLKLFLKSPKQDKEKPKPETRIVDIKKKILSPSKNKKWYKQPFQKFGQRRADPVEDNTFRNGVKKEVYIDRNLSYLVSKEKTASPRQRNRIKTNPWLSTEPISSQNFQSLEINFSPSLTRNRSCTNTPLQNRKTNDVDSIQNRIKQMSMKYEESKEYLNGLEKIVSQHIGQKLCLELSDHSEEDITLNEMMGTYNESYVYEKETDILSDSDPTDCEDYVSDSEADNGGDERDSHDDELDFIDNGSMTESDDNFPGNTGKCTYHDIYIKKNSLLFSKSDRRKGSESRKSFKREQDLKLRKLKEEKKRRTARKMLKCDEEERRKRSEEKVNENVGGLNLGRVLMQRMKEKNGSKSAEGTPATIRRRNQMKELRETHIGVEEGDEIGPSFEQLLLLESDSDKRYRQLMLEAESIFEDFQNSPVRQPRKKISFFKSKSGKPCEESVEIWKKTQKMCCPQFTLREQDTPTRKSPKNLGLRFDDTPKKFRQFDFDKKSSFKAKSSAHSPLDPLGPTFRNFTIFNPRNDDPKKLSLSSSDEAESRKDGKPSKEEKEEELPGSSMVPIAFQSVDLGKPSTSYCPQSEPVKRKIYSCSKIYDKLAKQFENKPTIFEESSTGQTRHGSLTVKRCWEPKEHRVMGNQKKSDKKDIRCTPSLSPRRSSMPSCRASPNVPHKAFDMNVFR